MKGRGDDALPAYLGEEIEIAEEREGHQQRPQVLADAGGFWVAWETVDENGLSRGLSVRRLGMDGRPEAAEVRLPAEAGEQRKLLTLDSPTPNSVVVRWWRQNVRGSLLEPLQQAIGPHGPSGPVTPRGD
jgi:extradiol dioxygenase family protein